MSDNPQNVPNSTEVSEKPSPPPPVQSKSQAGSMSTAEKLATGQIRILQAISIYLNDHPMKRGWYIFIILVLLTSGVLLYRFMDSKIETVSKERDKYFVALQPWQAAAAGIFPNQPPEKQLQLLGRDISSISNALAYAVPSLPRITVETFNGLPIEGLPDGETNTQNLKLHRLVIRNYSDEEIDNFRSRFQVPEPIIATKEINESVGTQVGWRPIKIEILSTGKAGRTSGGLWQAGGTTNYFLYPEVAFNPYFDPHEQQTMLSGEGSVSGTWELTIDKLPPSGYASILFFTSDSPEMTNYTKFYETPLWASPPNPSKIADTNELRFSLEGEYQFQALNKPQKQYFLVPISFNRESRTISSSEIQTNIGRWHPVILESY